MLFFTKACVIRAVVMLNATNIVACIETHITT